MRHYWLTSDAPDLPANAFQRAPGLKRPTTLEGGGKGGGGGSAPSYPDPNVVAQATTRTNEDTAAYNKALNLNNYTNPFGSQQSVQTGTDPNTGAPIYSTQVSTNPQLQGVLNGLLDRAGYSTGIGSNAVAGLDTLGTEYNGLNQGLFGLGTQSAALSGQLNSGAAQNAQRQGQQAAYAAQTQYLDPQFSQQKESLDAQLANQGITPGSQAYNNAMTNYNNQKQQSYSNAANQSILTGSQIGTQNWQNQLAGIGAQSGLIGQQAGLYGQAGSNLGAISGLYGQQVGISQLPYSNIQSLAGLVPGYSGTSQSAASPADISGLYNNQYQSQLAGYNAGQSSSNNMMGGLFGLGSAFLSGGGGSSLMGMFSDRRLKRDIKRIGTWSNGLGVYVYRYVWEKAARHIGFMADEVRRIAPAAVVRGDDGYDRVNYVLAVR